MDLFDRAMLYLVVGLLFLAMLPNIRRGSRVLWARWRERPPVSWWRALPDWCGWAIVMTAFPALGRFTPDSAGGPWPWGLILIFEIFVWGSVGMIHAGRVIDRFLSERFSKADRRRELLSHTEGRDQPFEDRP